MSLFRNIRKPPGYVISSVLISLGGILNGFDTGSIGAITIMPLFLSTISPLNPLMRGFTVSLIMLTGALPSFFAGQLANTYGRLPIVMAGAFIFMIGAILQGTAQELRLFLVGRAFCGFGEGLWMSNITVYITEIAPRKRRGVLVSLPQFGSALGVCLGYFTCYATIHIPTFLSFRIPFIIQSILSLILTCLCLFLPPSPRWLIQHGQRTKALKAIERLGISQVEAEKDILNPILIQQYQDSIAPSTLEGIAIIFRREYKGRTVLALFILGMIQLCGIDGVLYYAPTLFTQSGIPSQTASFLASGISAILMLCISIPAVLYSDRMGRRTSTLYGGLLLSACMIIIGALYAADSVHAHGIARWIVVVLIFVFALTYVSTWGIVGKIYASEIQPAETRASANCLAQGLNFFANWLIAFSTPIFLSKSAYGAYFLFGFLSLGTVAVLAFSMPETRGVSLEDIHCAFQEQRGHGAGSWVSGLRRWVICRGEKGDGGDGSGVELRDLSRVG